MLLSSQTFLLMSFNSIIDLLAKTIREAPASISHHFQFYNRSSDDEDVYNTIEPLIFQFYNRSSYTRIRILDLETLNFQFYNRSSLYFSKDFFFLFFLSFNSIIDLLLKVSKNDTAEAIMLSIL